MNFNRLRIGTKLWLAVSALVVTLPLLVAVAIWYFEASTARTETAIAQAERKIALSTRWAHLTDSAVSRILITAVTGDPAVHAMVAQSTATAIAEVTKLQKELGELPRNAAEAAQVKKIGELRQGLLDATARMNERTAADPSQEVRVESVAAIQAAAKPYLDAQADFVRLEQDLMQRVRDDFRAERHTMQLASAAVVALLLAVMVATAAWLIRSIRRPLDEGVALAGAIARGDLTRRGDATRGDEFGDLMRALNGMSEALARTVGEVRHAADQIATGSGQIATGNQDLSQRTESQAASLQETAASMEQLGSTVSSNADAARQATELATAASSVALEGGEAVRQVVRSMEAISASSRRIADIIGTIDGIAFQTNLLALNAAVEAARAGEQGRGFAVVAGEVRNLSHRAAEAAREIKELIKDSVAKVEAGSLQVGEAGRTMTDIVSQVQRLNGLIGTISTATIEQSSGIGLVGQTVTQLDQVTQQNAALVEESAAAAASLNQQAARLVEAVGVFVLSEDEGRRAIAQAQASSSGAALGWQSPLPAGRLAAAPGTPMLAAADPGWQRY